jgi:hypothetical protein
LIAKIGWGLGWEGVRELVDTGATAEQLETIGETIRGAEGVQDFHDLKTRRMGSELLVEVHLLVDSQLTVSEGHMIGDRVRVELLQRCEYVSQVLVHIDPEDDESQRKIRLLPGREEMVRRLERRWRGLGIGSSVERINFHYLKGVIDVEIVLPLGSVDDLDEAGRLSQELADATRREPHVGTVDVLFR